MASRAGLLVRRGNELAFLAAGIARCVVGTPRLTRLPWDSAQMTLIGGEVVPVLELGEPSGVLVMCELEGQPLALSGLSAERAGFWPANELGVEVDGNAVPAIDLREPLAAFRGKASRS